MIERKVQFTLETRDVVKAMQLASSRKIVIPIPVILFVGAVTTALGFYVFRGEDGFVFNYVIPFLILMLIVVVLMQYVLLPWQARQHARQSTALKDEITLEWDDDGVKLSGDHGAANMRWDEFHRWSENAEMILLFQSDIFFHVLPKSVVSKEQARDVTSQLKAAGVKKR